MTEVISVQFRGRGKVYFFDPAGCTIKCGDKVVVDTSKGMELGDCTYGNHWVDDTAVVQPLRTVIRPATEDDLRVEEYNRKREKEAFGIAEEKIAKHGLEMKLVDVECSFEGGKILFFFTADGRVDFRELVKDLAGVFRTRIELRQIGVRDEAKMLGGIGICGQPFCCSRFLTEFQPVSTKMAKTQSMSLNPSKISGCCGRLMCCLRYEQEAYEDLVKHVPKNGAYVETEEGFGSVQQVNLLRQTVKVRLDGTGDPVIHSFAAEDIAEVPGGRPPEGETPPHVLQLRPKKEKEPEEIEDEWAIQPLFASDTADSGDTEGKTPVPAEETERGRGNEGGSSHRNRNRNRNRNGERRPAEPDGKKPQKTEGKKQAKPGDKKPAPKSQKPEGKKPAEQKDAAPAGEKSEPRPHRSGNYRRRRYSKPRKSENTAE